MDKLYFLFFFIFLSLFCHITSRSVDIPRVDSTVKFFGADFTSGFFARQKARISEDSHSTFHDSYVPSRRKRSVIDQYMPNATIESCTPSFRVLGGNLAEGNVNLYAVQLRKGGSTWCTGFVYADDIVVTAAHCLIGVDVNALSVCTGVSSSSTICYKIVDYSLFNTAPTAGSGGDIAKLKVLGIRSRYCIPIRQSTNFTKCYTFGYGYTTSEDLTHNAEGLYSTELVHVPASDHGDYLSFSGINGSDTCNGDSGGPLLCISAVDSILYLLAITSYGYECGSKYPAFYLSVGSFRNFLIDDTNWLIPLEVTDTIFDVSKLAKLRYRVGWVFFKDNDAIATPSGDCATVLDSTNPGTTCDSSNELNQEPIFDAKLLCLFPQFLGYGRRNDDGLCPGGAASENVDCMTLTNINGDAFCYIRDMGMTVRYSRNIYMSNGLDNVLIAPPKSPCTSSCTSASVKFWYNGGTVNVRSNASISEYKDSKFMSGFESTSGTRRFDSDSIYGYTDVSDDSRTETPVYPVYYSFSSPMYPGASDYSYGFVTYPLKQGMAYVPNCLTWTAYRQYAWSYPLGIAGRHFAYKYAGPDVSYCTHFDVDDPVLANISANHMPDSFLVYNYVYSDGTTVTGYSGFGKMASFFSVSRSEITSVPCTSEFKNNCKPFAYDPFQKANVLRCYIPYAYTRCLKKLCSYVVTGADTPLMLDGITFNVYYCGRSGSYDHKSFKLVQLKHTANGTTRLILQQYNKIIYNVVQVDSNLRVRSTDGKHFHEFQNPDDSHTYFHIASGPSAIYLYQSNPAGFIALAVIGSLIALLLFIFLWFNILKYRKQWAECRRMCKERNYNPSTIFSQSAKQTVDTRAATKLNTLCSINIVFVFFSIIAVVWCVSDGTPGTFFADRIAIASLDPISIEASHDNIGVADPTKIPYVKCKGIKNGVQGEDCIRISNRRPFSVHADDFYNWLFSDGISNGGETTNAYDFSNNKIFSQNSGWTNYDNKYGPAPKLNEFRPNLGSFNFTFNVHETVDSYNHTLCISDGSIVSMPLSPGGVSNIAFKCNGQVRHVSLLNLGVYLDYDCNYVFSSSPYVLHRKYRGSCDGHDPEDFASTCFGGTYGKDGSSDRYSTQRKILQAETCCSTGNRHTGTLIMCTRPVGDYTKFMSAFHCTNTKHVIRMCLLIDTILRCMLVSEAINVNGVRIELANPGVTPNVLDIVVRFNNVPSPETSNVAWYHKPSDFAPPGAPFDFTYKSLSVKTGLPDVTHLNYEPGDFYNDEADCSISEYGSIDQHVTFHAKTPFAGAGYDKFVLVDDKADISLPYYGILADDVRYYAQEAEGKTSPMIKFSSVLHTEGYMHVYIDRDFPDADFVKEFNSAFARVTISRCSYMIGSSSSNFCTLDFVYGIDTRPAILRFASADDKTAEVFGTYTVTYENPLVNVSVYPRFADKGGTYTVGINIFLNDVLVYTVKKTNIVAKMASLYSDAVVSDHSITDAPARLEHAASIEWWVWAIVAVVIFCFLVCVALYYYKKKHDKTYANLESTIYRTDQQLIYENGVTDRARNNANPPQRPMKRAKYGYNSMYFTVVITIQTICLLGLIAMGIVFFVMPFILPGIIGKYVGHQILDTVGLKSAGVNMSSFSACSNVRSKIDRSCIDNTTSCRLSTPLECTQLVQNSYNSGKPIVASLIGDKCCPDEPDCEVLAFEGTALFYTVPCSGILYNASFFLVFLCIMFSIFSHKFNTVFSNDIFLLRTYVYALFTSIFVRLFFFIMLIFSCIFLVYFLYNSIGTSWGVERCIHMSENNQYIAPFSYCSSVLGTLKYCVNTTNILSNVCSGLTFDYCTYFNRVYSLGFCYQLSSSLFFSNHVLFFILFMFCVFFFIFFFRRNMRSKHVDGIQCDANVISIVIDIDVPFCDDALFSHIEELINEKLDIVLNGIRCSFPYCTVTSNTFYTAPFNADVFNKAKKNRRVNNRNSTRKSSTRINNCLPSYNMLFPTLVEPSAPISNTSSGGSVDDVINILSSSSCAPDVSDKLNHLHDYSSQAPSAAPRKYFRKKNTKQSLNTFVLKSHYLYLLISCLSLILFILFFFDLYRFYSGYKTCSLFESDVFTSEYNLDLLNFCSNFSRSYVCSDSNVKCSFPESNDYLTLLFLCFYFSFVSILFFLFFLYRLYCKPSGLMRSFFRSPLSYSMRLNTYPKSRSRAPRGVESSGRGGRSQSTPRYASSSGPYSGPGGVTSGGVKKKYFDTASSVLNAYVVKLAAAGNNMAKISSDLQNFFVDMYPAVFETIAENSTNNKIKAWCTACQHMFVGFNGKGQGWHVAGAGNLVFSGVGAPDAERGRTMGEGIVIASFKTDTLPVHIEYSVPAAQRLVGVPIGDGFLSNANFITISDTRPNVAEVANSTCVRRAQPIQYVLEWNSSPKYLPKFNASFFQYMVYCPWGNLIATWDSSIDKTTCIWTLLSQTQLSFRLLAIYLISRMNTNGKNKFNFYKSSYKELFDTITLKDTLVDDLSLPEPSRKYYEANILNFTHMNCTPENLVAYTRFIGAAAQVPPALMKFPAKYDNATLPAANTYVFTTEGVGFNVAVEDSDRDAMNVVSFVRANVAGTNKLDAVKEFAAGANAAIKNKTTDTVNPPARDIQANAASRTN